MQLWALLSQLHRHQEALYHGQIAVRISHFLVRDLKSFIKSLVYRENYAKMDKHQNTESKIFWKDGRIDEVKQSASKIELKSNQSAESIKSGLMMSARDSKREYDSKIKNDNRFKDNGILDTNHDQESMDSMDNEIETMSILVKGYKKIYPLIEFLENFLVDEFSDEDEGFNSVPSKINHDSDSEALELANIDKLGEKFASSGVDSKQMSKLDRIEKIIRRQQRKFIRSQLAEAVREEGVNAENLLGFINQKKLNSYLNISNIMRLKKLDFKDIYSMIDLDLMLLRESVLERFMLTITSYFWMGTELRFLRQLKVQGFKDSIEAQFWHGRALEMAIALFPGDSPLVKHIIQSYQKHHAPSSEIIPEDYSISHEVKVAKPNQGVHSNKAYPMIQNVDYIYDDENITKEDENNLSDFDKKRLENKRNCMIRITSLDMPTNEYMNYVKKVINELNLKEDNEDEKQSKINSPLDIKDKQLSKNMAKEKLNKESDDINSNSVLEINNIIDSDGKADDDEPPIPEKPKKNKTGAKNKAKNYKPNSNANKNNMMIKESKRTMEASTQYTPKEMNKKPKTKDVGIIVAIKETSVKPKPSLRVSVATETDVKMNSKEFNSEATSLQSTSKKKSGKQLRKNSKSNVPDFEEEFSVSNYDLSKGLNRGKRQK